MASKRVGTAETKWRTVAEAQRLAALRESATRLSEQTDGQDLLDPVLKVTHVGTPHRTRSTARMCGPGVARQ